MIDLISEGVGGRVVACNDEFFAAASNLLKLEAPIWKEGVYTERGKWMDGWETRRRRDPGHDWCVIALGIPGRIARVTVDTAHFTGNYPSRFSLEVSGAGADDQIGGADWVEVIGQTDLEGDSLAVFDLDTDHRVTHLRLNIFPDGGVARLKVEGDALPGKDDICPDGDLVDLAGLRVGGEVIESSDSYFSPPNNMLRPTDPGGMWDGWETRRRRGPGHDWVVARLGVGGNVEALHVDTRFFRGNSPGWISFHTSYDGESWEEIVARHPVEKDSVNEIELPSPVAARFVKLDIHPDGGVARLRVMGRADRGAAGERLVTYANTLLPDVSRSFFRSACAASKWVAAMTASRPFDDVTDLLGRANETFETLVEDDWLEAFAGHPRIGGGTGDTMAAREQAGAAEANSALLAELEQANADYEERFGFTYIVYATGKSASQMLQIVRERLSGGRDDEIANAAVEQRKITATRLRRMLCQDVDE